MPISRWHAALNEGRSRAVKCGAPTKTSGAPCRQVPRRGSPHCYFHTLGAAKDAADLLYINKMQRWLSGTSWQRMKALHALRRISRRQIYRLWLQDPRAPEIDFLELSASDETRVAEWLYTNWQINLDKPLPGTSRKPTARCRDRLRYAAYFALRRADDADPEFLKRIRHRVILALRDDRLFWEKYDAAALAAE